MLRRRTGWIGIDVGSRSVKVAQVERDPLTGLRLRQAAVVGRRAPWPEDNAGMSSRGAPSASEIAAALDYGKRFAGSLAAFALPMHVYGFRGMHIPPGSLEERRSMLAAALQDGWDDCHDPCEFDFWETDIPGKTLRKEEPNVNVMAVSQPWTRRIAEDARRASLRLRVLDGPPLAISRAVHLASTGQADSPAAAVDWGFTSTTFCVAQRGQALFTRRIRSCGLRLVCQAVQVSLGVTLDEAQHLLLAFGFPRNDVEQDQQLQQCMAGAARTPLGRLVDEIKRTLAYFRAQRRELIPVKIWLMGGGASVRNAAAWLSHSCGEQIEVWHLPAAEQAGVSSGQRGPSSQTVFPQSLLAGAIALSALPLPE